MTKTHVTETQNEQALRAIHQEGVTVRDIAKALGAHRATIYRWSKLKTNKKSLARQTNPMSGRPPIISGQTSTQLMDFLAQPATEFGFDTDLWNTARIR